MWRVLLLVTGLLWLPPAGAWGFRQAGERYQIDPLLLQAIAIKESRLNTRAIGYNRNKAGQITSRDYGLMQINERHIPVLRRYGVLTAGNDLLTDACLNVQAGAWVLARHLQKCGPTWDCIGSYNAGFAPGNAGLRQRYARDIRAIWLYLRRQEKTG